MDFDKPNNFIQPAVNIPKSEENKFWGTQDRRKYPVHPGTGQGKDEWIAMSMHQNEHLQSINHAEKDTINHAKASNMYLYILLTKKIARLMKTRLITINQGKNKKMK